MNEENETKMRENAVKMTGKLRKKLYGERMDEELLFWSNEFGVLKEDLIAYVKAVLVEARKLPEHPGRGQGITREGMRKLYEKYIPVWRSWKGAERLSGNLVRMYVLMGNQTEFTAHDWMATFRKDEGYKKLARLRGYLRRRNLDGSVRTDPRSLKNHRGLNSAVAAQ